MTWHLRAVYTPSMIPLKNHIWEPGNEENEIVINVLSINECTNGFSCRRTQFVPQCLGAEHCVSAVACGGGRLTLVHWSSGENSFIWSPAADFHREVRGHGSGSGRRVAPPELPGSRSRSHEVTRIEGGILVVRNGPGLICWSCRMDLNKREHFDDNWFQFIDGISSEVFHQ